MPSSPWPPTPCNPQLDSNARDHSVAAVQPGSWLRLTSTQGCVHVTIAFAALRSLLAALNDWQVGHWGLGMARHGKCAKCAQGMASVHMP